MNNQAYVHQGSNPSIMMGEQRISNGSGAVGGYLNIQDQLLQRNQTTRVSQQQSATRIGNPLLAGGQQQIFASPSVMYDLDRQGTLNSRGSQLRNANYDGQDYLEQEMVRSINLNSQGTNRGGDFSIQQHGLYQHNPAAMPRYKGSDLMDLPSQIDRVSDAGGPGDKTPQYKEESFTLRGISGNLLIKKSSIALEASNAEQISQMEQELERMRNKLEMAKGHYERKQLNDLEEREN